MFWLGFISGFLIYVLVAVVCIIYMKIKQTKARKQKQEYDTLVDAEILRNKGGNK